MSNQMLPRCRLGAQIAPAVVYKFVPGFIYLLPLDMSGRVVGTLTGAIVGAGVSESDALVGTLRGNGSRGQDRPNGSKCDRRVTPWRRPGERHRSREDVFCRRFIGARVHLIMQEWYVIFHHKGDVFS